MQSFLAGFLKTAGIVAAGKKMWNSPKALDYAGLATLGAFPAHDIYKGIKNKDNAETARGAAEVGGLGLLARSVAKAAH